VFWTLVFRIFVGIREEGEYRGVFLCLHLMLYVLLLKRGMWQQHVVYSCAAWESAIKAKVLTMFSNRKRRMRISIYRFLVLWISFFRFESSYLSSLCSRSLCLGCSEIKAVGWLIFSFSCDNTMKASYLHLQIPVSTFIFKTAVENHPGWKLAMKPLANLTFFSSSWFHVPLAADLCSPRTSGIILPVFVYKKV